MQEVKKNVRTEHLISHTCSDVLVYLYLLSVNVSGLVLLLEASPAQDEERQPNVRADSQLQANQIRWSFSIQFRYLHGCVAHFSYLFVYHWKSKMCEKRKNLRRNLWNSRLKWIWNFEFQSSHFIFCGLRIQSFFFKIILDACMIMVFISRQITFLRIKVHRIYFYKYHPN